MAIQISPVNMEDRKRINVRPGDTVRVWQKIQEKGKTRLQAFEGLVLAQKHGSEAGATFTVRRVSGSVGVEKIFPLYSPMIDKIEIVRRSKVRRAKLYYIREKVAREIRRQMRNMRIMNVATVSDIEEKEAQIKASKDAEEAEKKSDEEKVEKADVKEEIKEEDKLGKHKVENSQTKEERDEESPKKE